MAIDSPEFQSWTYHKIEAPVEQLSEVVELGKVKGFRGMNLTIPHKVEVLQYLDHVDPVAERMGAVNTLVYENGEVTGHNTDGFGVVSAIRLGLGVEVAGRPVVMIGAGGASRGACVQCLEEGCSELWVGNRSFERLTELVNRLKGLYPTAKIAGFQPGGQCPLIGQGAVLINATSLGLKADDACPVERAVLEQVDYVYDMVYGRHVTSTIREAKKLGKPAADGLGMLIHQVRDHCNCGQGRWCRLKS